MGVSLLAYQLKQNCKDELCKQLKILRDNYSNNEISEEALDKRQKILDEYKISYLHYPSCCADNIVLILNQDEYPAYDKFKIGYMAIFGKVENELSNPDSHLSYLDIKDIKQITTKIENNGITDKEGFSKYYSNLPQKVRNNLFGDWGDVGLEEIEYFWKDIKEIYEFYKDCEKNNSWVYLDYGP